MTAQVAPGATVHGYIRLRGEPVIRLFTDLRLTEARDEPGGLVWLFDGGLRLYLPDRPAIPDLPFELTVVAGCKGASTSGGDRG